MENNKQTIENKKSNFGCISFFLLFLGVSYLIYYNFSPKDEIHNDQDYYLESSFNYFVRDTVKQESFSKAIESAISIIQDNSNTNQAAICRKWLIEKKVDTIVWIRRRNNFFDSIREERIAKAKKSAEIQDSHPADDKLNYMAFMQAKDFVEKQLKAPSSADFSSDYKWVLTSKNTYIIKSTVEAQNSYGAEIKSQWYVRLRFKGGEDADINNWELLEIVIN